MLFPLLLLSPDEIARVFGGHTGFGHSTLYLGPPSRPSPFSLIGERGCQCIKQHGVCLVKETLALILLHFYHSSKLEIAGVGHSVLTYGGGQEWVISGTEGGCAAGSVRQAVHPPVCPGAHLLTGTGVTRRLTFLCVPSSLPSAAWQNSCSASLGS